MPHSNFLHKPQLSRGVPQVGVGICEVLVGLCTQVCLRLQMAMVPSCFYSRCHSQHQLGTAMERRPPCWTRHQPTTTSRGEVLDMKKT